MAEDAPYVGPRPYESDDRGRFFGRDDEIRELLSLVVAHRVVLVYAASGAGKTSLLNAGLIPLLEENRFQVLPVVRVGGLAEAGEAGNPYVANALAALRGPASPAAETATLPGLLASRDPALDDDGLPAPTALLFDQFEELFSFYPERWSERREVFVQIAEAMEQDELLRVVIALREDFVAQLDPYAAVLQGGLRTRFRLERLRPTPALAAVTRPLAGERRTFAPGTAERLIESLLRVRVFVGRGDSVEVPGEFVEPVQLQVVCRSLWANLAPDVETIDDAHVAEFANVSDVLGRYYDEAVAAAASVGSIEETALRNRLEESFVTPVGTRGTVVAGPDDTAGIPNRAIEELEHRHVVRADWRAGARWFELTHDSLIEPIAASNAAVRRSAQVRRERRLKQLVAVLAAAALALVAAGVWLASRHSSHARTPLGVVEAVGPLARLELKRTFGVPVSLLSASITPNGHGVVAAGNDGRIRIWDLNANEPVVTLDYGAGGLSSLDVSGDGRLLVAGGSLGARLWNIASVGALPPRQVRIRRLAREPGSGPVRAASFDRTGARLAVIDSQGNVDIEGAFGLLGQAVLGRAVSRVAWSPSGKVIAGVADDGNVVLERVSRFAEDSGAVAPAAVPVAPGDATSPAAAAPPAVSVPTPAPGASARKARPRAGLTPLVLVAKGAVVSARFSRDGRTLVTAATDGRARLWRVRDRRLVRTIGTSAAPLADAAMSSDGRRVITAARDGYADIWSTTSGERLAHIYAARQPLLTAAFAADDQLVATATTTGTVRVWAVTTPFRPLTTKTNLAVGGAGLRYRSAKAWVARPGSRVQAPDAGVITAVRAPGATLRLRDTRGRTWVFSGVAPRPGLLPGRHVSAGEVIAAAVGGGKLAFANSVQIELWQRASGGHRLPNLWDPLLFLDLRGALERFAADYPGDSAPKAELAAWMARAAKAAGLPPELPVMAALVESGLQNVNYGDRDALGYFQLRRAIWDQGIYAGFPTDASLQLRWFVDHALDARKLRIATGRPDYARSPATYGLWVADVERPPEQYRGRYQLRLAEARNLIKAGGG